MANLNLTRFKALSFDCYGTLIDWEGGILNALEPWAASHGLALRGDELLSAFAGVESAIQTATPDKLYAHVLTDVLLALARSHGVRARDDEARAFGATVGNWPAFSDSLKALGYLKQHYALVILSNVDRISFALSNAKLGVEFDLIVTAEDVGSYKPNPAHFERAYSDLAARGIARHEILHVAQSLFHDIAPANRLAQPCVWVDRRFDRPGGGATPSSEATPDLRVTSLDELVRLHRAQLSG
jgi:2-haloacid dehalogenase